MITDSELLELEQLVDQREILESRNSLLSFTKKTFSLFKPNWFHEIYYDILDRFGKHDIKRLIISVPPQHGKSQGSSRHLPAWLFGRNPDVKIALASYNSTFASKFNRDIQRIIDEETYNKIFPKTVLNESNVVSLTGSWLRNSNEFEIVNKIGSFKSVGVGGGLTGNAVDIMIMDDLYKDYQDATSPIVSERVWEWYLTVVKTRLHNDSQELIVFTRWDENDLIGRLEAMCLVKEYEAGDDLDKIIDSLASDQWLKINFTALKVGEPNNIDPRPDGAALWPERHHEIKLIETRSLDPTKFNALYQGDPESKEGRLYQQFRTYKDIPKFKVIKNQIDTADQGDDYLCSVSYGVPLEDSELLYVLDVIYTRDGMELTEPEVAGRLNSFNVNESLIESNNGGRGFARIIDKMTNTSVNVSWYHQSENKKARIFSNSATVNRRLVFPEHWESIYPLFFDHISTFKKDFTSKHDDGPDVLTAIVENSENKQPSAVINW